ncbi:tetratricopeptide repeat protein [Cyanobacteria bacterium FACHB-471]|nr:tetratricopeptide repeat protein [Cyanobacteria bacterium FACHB-471]
MKNYQAALDGFTQAIKLKTGFANAYNSRGNDRSGLGNKQGAIKDYDQAIQLKPDFLALQNGGMN